MFDQRWTGRETWITSTDQPQRLRRTVHEQTLTGLTPVTRVTMARAPPDGIPIRVPPHLTTHSLS